MTANKFIKHRYGQKNGLHWTRKKRAPFIKSVRLHSMKSSIFILAIYFLSSSIYGAEPTPVNCHGPNFEHGNLGELGDILYSEEVSFKKLLKESLGKLSEEAEYISSVVPLPEETESYISEAIRLLEGSEKIYSCIANLMQLGDVIYKFKEQQANETRIGYAVLRANKPVAYIYDSIIVI
jgi:hypothetical protein